MKPRTLPQTGGEKGLRSPRGKDGQAYEAPGHGLRRIRDHHLEQQSVRPAASSDFESIVRDGFCQKPARNTRRGLEESPARYETTLLASARPVIELISSRLFRDWANRRRCIAVYGTSCSVTGVTLAFRPGATLCEACHIWPVSKGGPDFIQNLILLSPDAHRAWDAGLLALADDFRILLSPRLRAGEIVLAPEYGGYARVPNEPSLRPAITFLRRHRENRFLASRP